MRKIVLFVLLIAAPAQAGTRDFGKKLDAVALNASASLRTITLSLNREFRRVSVQYGFVRAAYTALSFAVTCNINGSLQQRAVQTQKCDSGICDYYDYVGRKTTSSSWGGKVDYDAVGCDTLTILVGSTGGAGSDNVTAYVTGEFLNPAQTE